MKLQKSLKLIRNYDKISRFQAYLIVDEKGQDVATIHAYTVEKGEGVYCRVDISHPGLSNVAQHTGSDFLNSMDGATVAGIGLYDACTTNEVTRAALNAYLQGNAEQRAFLVGDALARGMEFMNQDANGEYRSLYYIPGLDRLVAFGLRVYKVL